MVVAVRHPNRRNALGLALLVVALAVAVAGDSPASAFNLARARSLGIEFAPCVLGKADDDVDTVGGR